MAHEIDQSTGRAAIAYVGEKPWHGLGNELPEDATLDRWPEAAGLDWEAVPSTVYFKDGKGNMGVVPARHVLYRSDTNMPLSIVSAGYKAVQPAQVLSFFHDFVDKMKTFKMHTAGSLRDGKKIWALAKANDVVQISKQDTVERYLLMATSFDKSLPTLVQQTSVRVVCANTLATATGTTDKRITVRHMSVFDRDEVKARMMIDKEWAEFAEMAKLTSTIAVTEDAARTYFKDVLYPESVREGSRYFDAGAERAVDRMMYWYEAAPGQQTPNTRGRAWGLVNAVTYFVDHEIKARSQDNRLDRAWFGTGASIKSRAFSQAIALAK